MGFLLRFFAIGLVEEDPQGPREVHLLGYQAFHAGLLDGVLGAAEIIINHYEMDHETSNSLRETVKRTHLFLCFTYL